MSPATYIALYWARLRTHPLQEVLAATGVAVGVALAFAVMIANGSITASSEAIVRSVVGTADWQLASRDLNGTSASVLRDVRRIPGVQLAAPVLEQRGVVTVSHRQVPVNVAGATPELAQLSGRFGPLATTLQLLPGVMLTSAAADALAIPNPAKIALADALPTATLRLRGRPVRLAVSAIAGDQLVGPLATTPAAIISLARLQVIAEMKGRVTRVLVDAEPGREEAIRARLARIAADRHLGLARADAESALLRQALGPSDWTTKFFAAISALVGLLLAFNAMLLTAPLRRREIASMRLLGLSKRQASVIVCGQAAALGIIASTVGVAVGWLLAQRVFDASPAYLSPAFIPGSNAVLAAWPLFAAFLGGISACVLASLPLLYDLRTPARPATGSDHGAEDGVRSGTPVRLVLFAALAGASAVGLVILRPETALASVALLAIATVCATPMVFRLSRAFMDLAVARLRGHGLLTAAAYSLRATPLRSLALAATGAVAVFGCVSIGGARSDLLRGIASYTSDYVSTADLWIVNENDNQATIPIATPNLGERAATVPGVKSVRAYHGSFLDWDGRRVWVIARPTADHSILPASQVREGSIAAASKRILDGGNVALSEHLAARDGIDVGGSVTIPTAAGPARFRVAALTTNLGWTPGAVIMSAADYRAHWPGAPPTAFQVELAPGADVEVVRARLETLVGSGLDVQAADERAAGINASAQQGLERLRQISLLLLVGAILAMAAAMSAAIWQRRPGLATMRIHGLSSRDVWLVLLLETSVVLAAGCATGVLVGLAGQVAIDQYLMGTTGFPVAIALAGRGTAETFAAVLAAAIVVVAIPGWKAACVPPLLGLQRE